MECKKYENRQRNWKSIENGWGDMDDDIATADNYLPRILEVQLDIRQLLKELVDTHDKSFKSKEE